MISELQLSFRNLIGRRFTVDLIMSKRCIASGTDSQNKNSKKFAKTPIVNKGAIMRQLKGTAATYATLQVIQSGCAPFSSVVHLRTDNNAYLFNCAEGTQRIMSEHNIGMARLSTVFTTRSSWSCAGGLLGLFLHAQGAGVKAMGVYGGPKTQPLVHTARPYQDQKLTMATNFHSIEKENVSFDDGVINVEGIALPSTDEQQDAAIAYVIAVKSKLGKIDMLKCKQLGVPFGPRIGELQRGADITLEDGSVIKSSDVTSDRTPAERLLIVDCPSAHHLSALDLIDTSTRLKLIVHMSNNSIVQDPIYQQFLKKFNDSAHLYVNDASPTLPHTHGAHRLQYHLNRINPDVYPLLPLNNVTDESIPFDAESKSMHAEPLLTYHVRGGDGYVRQTPDDVSGVSEDIITCASPASTSSADYPFVTMLGTSSASPCKYRNVSSILVRVNENTNAILDCGEGTYMQLCDHYGVAKADEILINTRYIFISHLHQDHYLGIITLLQRRRQLQQETPCESLYVHGPAPLFNILRMVEETESVGYSSLVTVATKDPHDVNIKNAAMALNAHSVESVPVLHAAMPNALFLRLKQPNSVEALTIVYSGDTMPCESLAELMVKESVTLLIHEATLDDSDEADARMKKHCMMLSALDICRRSGAKRSLLTHFSGRFARLPIIKQELLDDKVSVANDHLEFSVQSQLPTLYETVPCLVKMFPMEHSMQVDDEALKMARIADGTYVKAKTVYSKYKPVVDGEEFTKIV